jgi:hypothetical protein
MAPIPKPAATRQRRNRTTTQAVLEAPPAQRVDLPPRDPTYHSMTLRWWATIWDSPMAAEWVDADTPGLIALAKLVDAFWVAAPGDAPKIAAEIRLQQREYGLSPLSRRSLQWEVQRVEREQKKPVAQPAPRRVKDPRAMLKSGVVQGGRGG